MRICFFEELVDRISDLCYAVDRINEEGIA